MKRTHVILHCPDKSFTVSKQIFSVLITVFLHTSQEPCQRFHERIIVHNCIPFITLEPSFRITIMFSQNDCIRISSLNCFAEIFPEFMVKLIAVTQVCCHVKSPSIYVVRCRYPFLSYMKNIVIKFLRTFIIQLRKCIVCPPSIISRIVWPFIRIIKGEEISVWTVSGNISSFRISLLVLINALSVHPFIKRTAVVEYTIQNDLHSSSVDLCCQFGKQFVAGLQILLVCDTFDIFPCMGIIAVIPQKDSLIAVLYDPAVMRVYIVIILAVIFVVTW